MRREKVVRGARPQSAGTRPVRVPGRRPAPGPRTPKEEEAQPAAEKEEAAAASAAEAAVGRGGAGPRPARLLRQRSPAAGCRREADGRVVVTCSVCARRRDQSKASQLRALRSDEALTEKEKEELAKPFDPVARGVLRRRVDGVDAPSTRASMAWGRSESRASARHHHTTHAGARRPGRGRRGRARRGRGRRVRRERLY